MANYFDLVKHYEECFLKYGDTPKGQDWPNNVDLLKRYEVMWQVSRGDQAFSLLDFGCGTAMFKQFIDTTYPEMKCIYAGLDLGRTYAEYARIKYPETEIYHTDILHNDIPHFDYIVMNGVLTEKRGMTFDEMWAYSKALLRRVFELSNKGFAFNVMSKMVDWERDDLFHLPLDLLQSFICKELNRKFVIRNDYGLYEFTCYVYH